MKAVLTSKVVPDYDDLPEQRYHFPKTYLRQIEQAVGDWVIYYEPRRSTGNLASKGGRQAYFATAHLDRIIPDPVRPDHYYAMVSNFLEFDRPVPFSEGQHYYERALKKNDGSTNKGAFGRSVRNISDNEYDLILAAGFSHVVGISSRHRPPPDVPEEPHGAWVVHEEQGNYGGEPAEIIDRPILEQLVQRRFRDRAFAVAVKSAYHDTCAMTGIKIINGGGRSEVQAAHIRPVAENGPDSVRNGLALSGTVHWMFDRGLISVSDDYHILVASDRLPDTVSRLLREDRRLILPVSPSAHPHSKFLDYHRNQVFKG